MSERGSMNILLFSARLGHRGGTIRRLGLWFAHMPDGVDVTFLYAPTPGQDCSAVLGAPRNVRFREVTKPWLKSLVALRLAAASELAKEIMTGRYDVVMPVLADTEILAFPVIRLAEKLLRRKIRIVCHCAGKPVPEHVGRVKAAIYESALKRVYRGADQIVAISEQMKLDLIRDFGVEERRVVVVPISVEAKTVVSGRGSSAVEAGTVFGVVGRLHGEKHVDHILRAFAEVSKTHPVRLLVFGDGPAESALKDLARSLDVDDVEFCGWTPVAELLERVDCVVMSSEHEGTPRSILEAGSAAIPSIASAVGGIPDIINDGETGWLYPYGDLDALGATMRYVAEHAEERRKVGANAREYVRTVHSPEVEVQRLLESLWGTKPDGMTEGARARLDG